MRDGSRKSIRWERDLLGRRCHICFGLQLKSGNREWRMDVRRMFYESTSQYNWASLSAVGTVRPDRLISARLRRKFSNFQQPSPIVLLPVVLPDITEYTVKQELPY